MHDQHLKDHVLPETFTFRGHAIRYGVKGRGPAAVLVHGTPWSSYNLRHLVNGLSSSYTCYYYDMLGYGCSSKLAPDISLGIQNQILAALLQHWKLDCPIGIGHDFGGGTLLRAAILNQVEFSRLILIDPVAIVPWGSAFYRHVQQHAKAFEAMPPHLHEGIVRCYIQSAAHRTLDAAVLHRTAAYWLGEHGQPAFYRQIVQSDDRFTREVQPMYPYFTTETLILWGEEDNWIPLERAGKLAATLPAAKVKTIPNAGHLVIEEQPEALLQEMKAFLSRLAE